jgi:hypothetical protein
MSAPTRKPVVIAEATQELRANDVVGVLDTIGTVQTPGSVSGVSLPRNSLSSQASVAPVGLDLAHGRNAGADAGDDEEIMQTTSSVVLPARRRNLSKIVFGTLGACAIILLAAGVARIGHAMNEPAAASGGTSSSIPTANPASTTATTTAAAPASPPKATGPASVGATDPASAGTVRLGRPTLAGHVWLDGKKLSATSVLVSCGTHQVKVGHGRKHSIDVPCGGEVSVSR